MSTAEPEGFFLEETMSDPNGSVPTRLDSGTSESQIRIPLADVTTHIVSGGAEKSSQGSNSIASRSILKRDLTCQPLPRILGVCEWPTSIKPISHHVKKRLKSINNKRSHLLNIGTFMGSAICILIYYDLSIFVINNSAKFETSYSKTGG